MFSLSYPAEDQQQQQKTKKCEAKGPQLNTFQPMAGQVNRGHDSEGEITPPSLCGSQENVNSPQSDNNMVPDAFSEGQRPRARPRGRGGNKQSVRKAVAVGDAPPPPAKEEAQGNDFAETQEELQESAGATHLCRKARKPDQQFYRPGSRRSAQEREPGADREPARPPHERSSHSAQAPPQDHTQDGAGGKPSAPQEEGGEENRGNGGKPTGDRPNDKNRKKDRKPSEDDSLIRKSMF
jgi:hypothetical protein